MDNKVSITCITDIANSTRLTEELGHDGFLPHALDHRRVGELLAQQTGATDEIRGRYIKSTGDGHLVSFDYLEAAIRFSVYVQQYYAKQCCCLQPPVAIRVGLFLGVVQPNGGDIFGSGVNQAARVEGAAAQGQVLVNAALFRAIKTVWGAEKAAKYFSTAGEHELKGIGDPPKQELFELHWQEYARDYPEYGLAQLVWNHLDTGKVELSNLGVTDLANPHSLIWPVVPRAIVTAIHRGQAEIIRMLARLGWEVHVLIADCGSKNYEREYCQSFYDKLRAYSSLRHFSIGKVTYSSELFDPANKGYSKTQDIFRRIAAHLTLADLLKINNKSYDEQVQIKDETTPTLDFLRPAITMASVLHLAQQSCGKCLVVAGRDERTQWDHTYSLSGETRSHLGVIMNPMLSGPQYQYKQKDDQPIWNSCPGMVAEMDNSNLAWWSYHMHAYLPAFPAGHVQFGDNEISPRNWTSETELPPCLTKEDLAACCWQILDPNLRAN